MLTNLFLGISLVGAEWVLYLLVLLSIISISLIIERVLFYKKAQRGLLDFRASLRQAVSLGEFDAAKKLAEGRFENKKNEPMDLETKMSLTLLSSSVKNAGSLHELATDALLQVKLHWEKNLAFLATIGSNAVFVGLFGTVLGVIHAFHDLSQKQLGAAAQGVTSGISEALVATAVGLLVAIPAVVAFNIFQRRVKDAVIEAEALKSFLIGKLDK